MTTKKLTDYLKQQTPTQSGSKIEQAELISTKIRFKKETEFQETPIGKISKEWRMTRLSELATEMYYGVTAKAVEHNTGVKFLRTTDIKDYKASWDSLPFCEITSNSTVNMSRYALRKGDIIVSRAGTVGMSVYVENDMPDVVFGSYLIKIRVNDKIIIPKFLHYYFQAEQYWTQILASSKGSTLKNISLPVLESLVVPVPPHQEQSAIIEILSKIDFVIEKVGLLVDRAERFKKGLMHELLTKGIGHREYKETPIGKIPKEWRLVNLGDVVEIWDKYRVPVKESERVPGPYPYCGANGVIGTINGYTHDGEFVLLAEDGGFYGPFEKTAYLMKGKFWANNHVHVLRAKQGVVLNEYLVQYLNFADLRPFVSGTTRPKLPQNSMIRIPIALPPLHEQKQIAEILSNVDRYKETLEMKLDYLERVKRGLMEVLLTGKVRVITESS